MNTGRTFKNLLRDKEERYNQHSLVKKNVIWIYLFGHVNTIKKNEIISCLFFNVSICDLFVRLFSSKLFSPSGTMTVKGSGKK